MNPSKFATLLAVALLLFLTSPTSSRAQNVGEMYEAARTAFAAGDPSTAANLLDQIIKAQPTFVPARALRAQVQQQLDAKGGGDELEKKCASTILPKIEFEDVDLKLALEALAIATADATADKFRPNLILNGGEEVGARRVSLKLRNVPLSTALEYLGKIASVDFRYERFAIVGTPKPTAAAAPSPAPEAETTFPAVTPVDPFKKR